MLMYSWLMIYQQMKLEQKLKNGVMIASKSMEPQINILFFQKNSANPNLNTTIL